MRVTGKLFSSKLVASFLAAGIIVSPAVVSGATASQSNTVTASVSSTITVTATNPTAIAATPGASAVYSNTSHNVSVSTNNATGYNLTLSSSDGTNALNHTDGTTTIAASSNTTAAPAALATNTWGFAITQAAGVFDTSYTTATNQAATGASKWAGVPVLASPYTLKSTAINASSDLTTVWYAIEVDSTKKSGTYTDNVVYTATTN